MPRSVYRQCSGNPIQLSMVPTAPLELEFAYRRGVDNDDNAHACDVLKRLAMTSLVGVVGCWLQLNMMFLSYFMLFVAALLFSSLIVAAISRLVESKEITSFVVVGLWIYHFLPLSTLAEVTFALIANLLVSRELVRHFTFVSTVAPTPIQQAWDIREAVNWQTAISSLPLIQIALCILIPQYAAQLLYFSSFSWLLIAVYYGGSPKVILTGFWEAIQSWCSYNRDELQLPGILVSPSGRCRTRQTLLVVAVLLNAFALFRFSMMWQVSNVIVLYSNLRTSIGIFELLFNLVVALFLLFSFALLPLLILLLSILIVGTPVFGRIALPRPSFVPAEEWKEITERIRRSENATERNSLYLGRVAFDQSPLLVPTDVFREHAHFLGDSGSGKTARGLSPFIEQVVGSGKASVMVLDLKGDSPELLQTLRQGAATAKSLSGTDVPIRYFTLRDEHATFGFNPFSLTCWSQLNELQKTDILCGALGLNYGTDYGEGYFSSANASVLYATVTHFPGIKSFEQLRDKLIYVLARPKAHGLDDKSRDAGNHVKMSVTRLASVAALNITDDHTPNADVSRLSIDPSRMFEHPEAHYFSLSATLGPGSSPEVGRLATYMLLTSATLSERKVPVYLVIDEFQRMASRNLDYLLQLARSMGVAVILANQSMQDLQRYDLIPTLETNCRFRQWFAISGWDDQDRLSKASGETVDTLEAISVTNSTNQRGRSTSVSESSHQFIGPRLTKNDIKLVSDNDSKSIVLINRGAGYAQYGGMPVIVESDFHISPAEYRDRKQAPWPATDSGTFVPANWKPPVSELPHRGRKSDTSPAITQETISIGHQEQGEQSPTATKSKGRRAKSKKIDTTQSTASSEPVDLFERYLQEHPIESASIANLPREEK